MSAGSADAPSPPAPAPGPQRADAHHERAYMIDLGQRLRRLREERGLTQERLAQRASVATSPPAANARAVSVVKASAFSVASTRTAKPASNSRRATKGAFIAAAPPPTATRTRKAYSSSSCG